MENEEPFINVEGPNKKSSLIEFFNKIKENGGNMFTDNEESIEITVSVTIRKNE